MGENDLKTPAHVYNHCYTCHFFLGKRILMTQTELRIVSEILIKMAEYPYCIKKRDSDRKGESSSQACIKMNTCSTFTWATDLRKENAIEIIAPIA